MTNLAREDAFALHIYSGNAEEARLGARQRDLAPSVRPPIQFGLCDPSLLKPLAYETTQVLVVWIAWSVILVQPLFEFLSRCTSMM